MIITGILKLYTKYACIATSESVHLHVLCYKINVTVCYSSLNLYTVKAIRLRIAENTTTITLAA